MKRTLMTDIEKLHEVSTPAIIGEELNELLDDMWEILNADKYAVGISAIQLGIPSRVFIAKTDRGNLECINPEILTSFGKQGSVEGCLSIPGCICCLTRPKTVLLKYQDRDGHNQQKFFEGFPAALISHEMDHLNGKLMIDGEVVKFQVPEAKGEVNGNTERVED